MHLSTVGPILHWYQWRDYWIAIDVIMSQSQLRPKEQQEQLERLLVGWYWEAIVRLA